MKTLRTVLLLIGATLCVYGIYVVVTPEFSVNAGPLKVEAQDDHTETYAMIAFGVLMFLAGLAFRKK